MSRWLINPAQLAALLNRDSNTPIIIDCRFSLADTNEGERLYRKSHITGAYYLHLDRDLSGAKNRHGGRHPLPDPAVLATRLRELGINRDTLIVAYDDNRLAFSSRLWWLLRYLGHDQIKVLDGGFQAWRDAGLSVNDTLPATPSSGNFNAQAKPEMVVDIDAVKALQLSTDTALIDAREEARYLGLEEPIDPVAGHIEGAVNYPWQQVTDGQGKFIETEQQRARWQDVLNHRQLTVYCGSGVTACVNLLALAELGREDAKLYAGSWSDWCSYF